MEITLKSQQKIAQNIVDKFNNGDYVCIKDIIHNTSIEFIHTIHKHSYALCAEKPTQIKQKDFFIVIQHCLFLLLLYKNGLIIIDKSVKNEPCNEYSNKGDYEYYSFNEVCGDDDLGSFVCYNWSLPIIPTTDLIELVKNKFKTPEQRRFEEQLEEAKDSTCWSRIAAILAFFTLAITFFQTCCDKQNNSEQLNSIITAIKEQKTVTVDSIKVLPADTFDVKIIQPKAKPALKPQQNPLKQPIPKK